MIAVPPSPTAVKKRKRKWRRYFFLVLILLVIGLSLPEYFHKNSGVSQSIGSVRDGRLENGWLLPHVGPNFHYFSGVSYYLMDNAYVHSSLYHAVVESYKTCETTCPGTIFRLMECSDEEGGRMWFHWTHQHGLSVDFMVPTVRGNTRMRLSEYTGLAHYLLKFDTDGRLQFSPKTQIDFEVMARHLLALDDAARANGLRIRKILFHTDMHDNLFSTPSGQVLAQRELRFVPRLGDLVNRFHDDHYHVDFEVVE